MRAPLLLLSFVACATNSALDNVALPVTASAPPQLRWEIPVPAYDLLVGGAVELADGHLVTGGWGQPVPHADLLVEAVIGPQGELSWVPWTTGTLAPGWVAVGEGDADADGDPDVLTVTGDMVSMTFRAFDETTRALVATSTAPVPITSVFSAVHLVESDGDALPELLVTSYWDVVVLDDDGTVLAQNTWGEGPMSAAVDYGGDGMMDAVGPDGTIYRGSDLQPLAVLPGATVRGVTDVDVDGDGDHDLLTRDATTWTLYDGVTLAPRWTLVGAADLYGPKVLDLDGNGTRDLIFGAEDTPGVAVEVRDPLTGALRTTVPRALPQMGGVGIVPWDHDQDGDLELLVGFWYSGGLYDPQRGWGYVQPELDSHPFVATGDPDGDGVMDALLPFYGSGPGQQWTKVDGLTGARGRAVPHAPLDYATVIGFDDLDRDGDDELILSSGTTYEAYGQPGGPAVGTAGGPFVVGTFHAAGPNTLVSQRLWTLTAVRGGAVLWTQQRAGQLEVADLNGDGIDELLHLTAAGIEVLEGATGALQMTFRGRWLSMDVGGVPGDVRIVAVQDGAGCTVDVLSGTAAGIRRLRSSAFAYCSRGVRTFNDHLFVPGVQLEVEDLTTGARDLLDLRVPYPEDIQPLDGGFVVVAWAVGVQAFDL